MISLKRLYDLQELDWDIQEHEKSLAQIKARLADNNAIVLAKRRLDSVEATLAKRGPVWKTAEFTVQQLDQRLKNTDEKLYGGSVTNPRELAAYQDEKSALQRQRGIEEEKLIELMVEVEELQSERDTAKESLATLESRRAVETTELTERQQLQTAELEKLKEAREGLTPEIPPQVLAVYTSLLKSRGGHAVAKVERSNCLACRITLPTGELQKAKAAEQIVQCSSCRRILYVV